MPKHTEKEIQYSNGPFVFPDNFSKTDLAQCIHQIKEFPEEIKEVVLLMKY